MPSGLLRQYAPDAIVSTVGSQTVTGYKEGTFVEAERTAETSSFDVGSDGEVTLIVNPNQSGTVKFTLQQSSPLNDYFNTLFQAIQQRNLSTGIVPLSVVDKSGTTVVNSKQAIIQKPAKVTFADKSEVREWTFICPYLDIEVGGESSL